MGGILLLLLRIGGHVASARSEEEIRERFYGNMLKSIATDSGEGSIAKRFDRVLQKEFSENDQTEGSSAKQVSVATVTVHAPEDKKDVQASSLPQKKVIDTNEPRTCKNKGCGETFKEKDNHESACNYHPGPAVFRGRMRGWKCGDVHVKEFDEFMEIPPCTKGE